MWPVWFWYKTWGGSPGRPPDRENPQDQADTPQQGEPPWDQLQTPPQDHGVRHPRRPLQTPQGRIVYPRLRENPPPQTKVDTPPPLFKEEDCSILWAAGTHPTGMKMHSCILCLLVTREDVDFPLVRLLWGFEAVSYKRRLSLGLYLLESVLIHNRPYIMFVFGLLQFWSRTFWDKTGDKKDIELCNCYCVM